jgi:hypothetical protein
MSTMIHEQVSIMWQDRQAEVDEELVPLILALWKLDIDTCNSCQENRPGIAWIEFLTSMDAEAFLKIVAPYPDHKDLHTVNGAQFVGEVPFWETLYGRWCPYSVERLTAIFYNNGS